MWHVQTIGCSRVSPGWFWTRLVLPAFIEGILFRINDHSCYNPFAFLHGVRLKANEWPVTQNLRIMRCCNHHEPRAEMVATMLDGSKALILVARLFLVAVGTERSRVRVMEDNPTARDYPHTRGRSELSATGMDLNLCPGQNSQICERQSRSLFYSGTKEVGSDEWSALLRREA